MPFAQLDSSATRVHYAVDGSGPPVVLIHGALGSGELWSPAVPLLADRYTVVRPDLRGAGQTTDGGGPLTITDLTECVAAVMKDAGLEPAHVVGHSMGAQVAAAVAAGYPGLTHSVVMHGGWVRGNSRTRLLLRMLGDLLAEDLRRFVEVMTVIGVGPAYVARFDDAALEAEMNYIVTNLPSSDRYFVLVHDSDITAELAKLRTSGTAALLIASDQDFIFTPEHHMALREALPHARETTISAGHAAPTEAMDDFIAIVQEFVADVDANGQSRVEQQ